MFLSHSLSNFNVCLRCFMNIFQMYHTKHTHTRTCVWHMCHIIIQFFWFYTLKVISKADLSKFVFLNPSTLFFNITEDIGTRTENAPVLFENKFYYFLQICLSQIKMKIFERNSFFGVFLWSVLKNKRRKNNNISANPWFAQFEGARQTLVKRVFLPSVLAHPKY